MPPLHPQRETRINPEQEAPANGALGEIQKKKNVFRDR